MKDGRKNKNIPFWVIIAVFLLISRGGVWFLLFLPFAIGGIVYYFAKKEMDKSNDNERPVTMFEIKKQQERDESRERAKELYSESEFEHLSHMKSPSHNEYEHYKNELDDLLAAGIIEKEEYRDRVARLRVGR